MKSKTKLMSIAAASLACVAIAGVGFASWVITGTVEDSTSGNVNIESVSDQRVSITADIFGDRNAVNYTYAADEEDGVWSTTGTDWLTQSTDGTKENLSIDLIIKVKGVSNLEDDGLKFTIETEDKMVYPVVNQNDTYVQYSTTAPGEVTYYAYKYIGVEDPDFNQKYYYCRKPASEATTSDAMYYDPLFTSTIGNYSSGKFAPVYSIGENQTNYSSAVSNKYIGGLDTVEVAYKQLSGLNLVATSITAPINSNGTFNLAKDIITNNYKDSNSDNATIYLTVTFKWGEAFGSKNPAEYFNTTYANANVKATTDKTAGDLAVEQLTALRELLLGKEIANVWEDANGDGVPESSEVSKSTPVEGDKNFGVKYNFLFGKV